MSSSTTPLMLVIACLLFLTFETTKVRGWYFQPKTHVSMTNSLPNKSDLTVHCKSKDNDLGTHVIPFNKSYEIVFHPNLLDTTLFYCNFRWPKNNSDHFFDIYDKLTTKTCKPNNSNKHYKI
ncbi:hypothetical protein G4B88_026770 [Cannabis sativa]|uniref:S-protein homolog n=1 Tax=Cannabis sativa TaxID=3483 RepID=A0A7J6F968_CANSA|nr:hypothetical protein G4B88_026770 [Cannabis sativa]